MRPIYSLFIGLLSRLKRKIRLFVSNVFKYVMSEAVLLTIRVPILCKGSLLASFTAAICFVISYFGQLSRNLTTKELSTMTARKSIIGFDELLFGKPYLTIFEDNSSNDSEA